jgi:hypothetical protein
MKHLIFHVVALMAAITLAGCGNKPDDGREHAGEDAARGVEIGVTYNPKSGLLIPAETAKFIGLETVEVAERPVNASHEISARVFRCATTSDPRALASASVAVADASLLRTGLAGTTSTDALAATVLRVDRTQEPQTGLVEAILQVEDTARLLADGEFIGFRFTTSSTNNVTAVPRDAVLHTTGGDFVYTVSGEYFLRAAVKLGRMDSEFAEVTEGLYAGDKVVVRPVMTLWMTELHSVNGGDACCIVAKPKE